MRRALLVLVCALGLTACAGGGLSWDWDPDSYIVREGDTLYSIAERYDLDYRELARRNGIGTDYVIYPGQRIQLRGVAPSSGGSSRGPVVAKRDPTPPARPPRREVDPHQKVSNPHRWVWPTEGEVVAAFGDAGSIGKGLDIRGREGQVVRAAAAGRVVYSGSGLIGYGQLIIVKHDDTFISAYGHNASLLVDEGDAVSAGQRIAKMGLGPGDEPLLHFEIRVEGQAVDPRLYLPGR